MIREPQPYPYVDAYGRRLVVGVFVEVSVADKDGGEQRFGQLTAGPDKDGTWEYRYIAMGSVNTGGETRARAAYYDLTRYCPEPKQTEEARATRRKLRLLGFRIKRSWGDGIVRMERADGITASVRLNGSITVSSEPVFYATAELIGEGFVIATSKGMI